MTIRAMTIENAVGVAMVRRLARIRALLIAERSIEYTALRLDALMHDIEGATAPHGYPWREDAVSSDENWEAGDDS